MEALITYAAFLILRSVPIIKVLRHCNEKVDIHIQLIFYFAIQSYIKLMNFTRQELFRSCRR